MIRIMLFLTTVLVFTGCTGMDDPASFSRDSDGSIYIVDKTGSRWDVTQAATLGFKPGSFQYGMGKGFFVPLDDSRLSGSGQGVSEGLRVIGVDEGETSHAYSVTRLSRHEVSNSTISGKPIAVGY